MPFTLAAVLSGLPPVAVSLEPAECPTEVQLARALSALGAMLVPLGSGARATVSAVRTEGGEWSLTLGRPGRAEKRKVTLSGGCDEQAAALAAIIERFARPVLVAAPRPAADAGSTPDAGPPDAAAPDAGAPDAGAAAEGPDDFALPFDAGLAAPPPPPPSLEVADAGAAAPASPRPFAVNAHLGPGFTERAVALVVGAFAEYRRTWLSLGLGLDYYSLNTFNSFIGAVGVSQARLHVLARLKLLPFLLLEGALGANVIWAPQLGDSLRFRPGLGVGVVGLTDRFDPIELWARLRGWGFLDLDREVFQYSEVLYFPSFFGELTVGVGIKI